MYRPSLCIVFSVPEYRMQSHKERRDGQITMRRTTWEALKDQLHALKEIETAARNFALSGTYSVDALEALRGALRKHDGWSTDQEKADEAIESLQNIIVELEGRDADL